MCCKYYIRKISSLFWSAFNSVLISNAYNKNVSTSAWKDLHTYLISLKYFAFSTETSLCSKEWSNLSNPAVSFWFWCCFLFFHQKPKTFELVNLLNWDSIAKQKMCIFFYVFSSEKDQLLIEHTLGIATGHWWCRMWTMNTNYLSSLLFWDMSTGIQYIKSQYTYPV